MNPVEHEAHTRKTDELAAGIELIAESTEKALSVVRGDIIIEGLRVETLARELVNREQSFRLNLAKEQRDYVDMRDSDLWVAFNALRLRGFWSRLNWLLTGR